METKLIFAKVQRALRSIFHGAQSKLSTEDTLIIHGAHGGHGSSEFKRNLNGYFWVARAQEILEEIFFKDVADARNQSSDLNGFRRNLFG